jgi:hypothetical protein
VQKQVLFLGSLNLNFSVTLDTIVSTHWVQHNLYTFETIVEGLRTQKNLDFYSLDYPTKVPQQQKNTLNSILC